MIYINIHLITNNLFIIFIWLDNILNIRLISTTYDSMTCHTVMLPYATGRILLSHNETVILINQAAFISAIYAASFIGTGQ